VRSNDGQISPTEAASRRKPRRTLRDGHRRHGFGPEQRLPAFEHAPGITGQIGGGAEQPGMGRQSAHPAGCRIVNDAADDGVPFPFGRSDPGTQRRIRKPAGFRSCPSGSPDFPAGERIESFPGDAADEFPEQVEVQIAVDHLCTGRRLRLAFANPPNGRVIAGREKRRSRDAGSQSRRMGQQLADGDRFLAVPGELRQVGVTGASSDTRPCSTNLMISGVVATTSVSDAKSKIVSSVIASFFGSRARRP